MSKCLAFGVILVLVFPGIVSSQEIDLDLTMPSSMFGPGSYFMLGLKIVNSGPQMDNCDLFVALTIGTGDFWFFPGWVHYPPDLDWVDRRISGGMTDNMVVIQGFNWPSGAGEFNGAMFLAAVIQNNQLVSNVEDITFGWTESNQGMVSVGTMWSITGDSFMQGSPVDEPCHEEREAQFDHLLTRNIAVMETEVSRQMWADLKGYQPTLPVDPSDLDKSPTMAHPAQRLTWYHTLLFSNLLSLQNGLTRCYYTDPEFTIPIVFANYTDGPFYCDFNANGYRLPTEGEWEFVCRAGSTGPFCCSESNFVNGYCYACAPGTFPTLEQYASFCGINNDAIVEPVGIKLPNQWGLKDVHGNVYEWCWDWYGDYPASAMNYSGPETGISRVLRSGSSANVPYQIRSAARELYTPESLNYYNGMRLVRTIP